MYTIAGSVLAFALRVALPVCLVVGAVVGGGMHRWVFLFSLSFGVSSRIG